MTITNSPSVVVVSGARAGTVLAIDEVLNDFVVGSDEGCHLMLEGAAISPMHAAFFLDDEGSVTLSDTKSRTGVFVNGMKILEQTLKDGDEISIGPPGGTGSGRLRFAAQGSDAPLIDLSNPEPDPGMESLAGLEGLDPVPAEALFFTSELGKPDFATDAGGLQVGPSELSPLPSPPEAAQEVVDEFPPLEMLSEPDPLPAPEPVLSLPDPAEAMVDEFPPLEMFSEPEPVPAPEPVPPPPVPIAPPAAPVAARPVVVKPVAAKPATAKPVVAKPVVAKPATGKVVSDHADDPLAGLAESLGATDQKRSEPPPALAEIKAVSAPGRPGRSAVVMAARLAVIAVVLGGLAWFVTRKYAASIVLPVVDTYLPATVEPGQTVTINGSGFGAGSDPTQVKVALGPLEAQVLDASPTRINITVPESLGDSGSQTLPLKVTARGESSAARQVKVAVTPKIASLTPRVALAGDEIAIAGKWLMNAKTRPTVKVAGNEAEILEATSTSIRIRVPEVAAKEGQKVSVRVAVGSDISKEVPLNYGRLPFVESVSPARAMPGDIVTLVGLGLNGPDLAVTVGAKSAAILSATDAEIKLSLPGLRMSESAGQRNLTVQVNERSSVAHPVEILHQSSALYSPRFFVEMLPGSRVAVSCELGPVMVLGSDLPSRKRAVDAAARLNALALQARASRVQFIAGDVVISAAGGAVLAVASGDGSLGPRSLAPLWAAHLTDMFDLFFQGRRPGRTVELSPDGKVFLDIFAAARRRSAEPGVAQGVLASPDPAWLRSLAALAAAPTLGGSEALALLDGFWSGVIEVQGAIQPRKVEISLTATPSGLVGQRTSRQGRLSSDVSLQGLVYARRELRFSLVDSGETVIYQGRLDGDVIEGTLTKASGARVGKLTFKLTR